MIDPELMLSKFSDFIECEDSESKKHKNSKIIKLKGGKGSGYFGHAGRIGKVGGSSKGFVEYTSERSEHGVYKFEKYSAGKVILMDDGTFLKSNIGTPTHTQILARIVIDNPSKYPKDIVKLAYEIYYYNIEEDSRFEHLVLSKNSNMFKIDRAFYPYKGFVITLSGDNRNDMARGFALVKRLIKSGKIKQNVDNAAEQLSLHFDDAFASINIKDIDEISGIIVGDRNQPIVQYKESKIIKLKGGKGSGHFGHAGRPGKQGGSAPKNVVTLSYNSDIQEFINIFKKTFGLKTKVTFVDSIESYRYDSVAVGVFDITDNSIKLVQSSKNPDNDVDFGKISISKPGSFLTADLISADLISADLISVDLISTASLGMNAIAIHELAHALDSYTLDGRPAIRYSDTDEFSDIYTEHCNSLTLESAVYAALYAADHDVRESTQITSDIISRMSDAYKTVISRYSTTEPREYFAEGVVAYFMDGDWLKENQPKLYNYLDKLPNMHKLSITDTDFLKELNSDVVELALSNGTYIWVNRSDIYKKKSVKIIKLKGGPGSGHKGHKGIPGHQGGSLPDNSSTITDREITIILEPPIPSAVQYSYEPIPQEKLKEFIEDCKNNS